MSEYIDPAEEQAAGSDGAICELPRAQKRTTELQQGHDWQYGVIIPKKDYAYGEAYKESCYVITER